MAQTADLAEVLSLLGRGDEDKDYSVFKRETVAVAMKQRMLHQALSSGHNNANSPVKSVTPLLWTPALMEEWLLAASVVQRELIQILSSDSNEAADEDPTETTEKGGDDEEEDQGAALRSFSGMGLVVDSRSLMDGAMNQLSLKNIPSDDFVATLLPPETIHQPSDAQRFTWRFAITLVCCGWLPVDQSGGSTFAVFCPVCNARSSTLTEALQHNASCLNAKESTTLSEMRLNVLQRYLLARNSLFSVDATAANASALESLDELFGLPPRRLAGVRMALPQWVKAQAEESTKIAGNSNNNNQQKTPEAIPLHLSLSCPPPPPSESSLPPIGPRRRRTDPSSSPLAKAFLSFVGKRPRDQELERDEEEQNSIQQRYVSLKTEMRSTAAGAGSHTAANDVWTKVFSRQATANLGPAHALQKTVTSWMAEALRPPAQRPAALKPEALSPASSTRGGTASAVRSSPQSTVRKTTSSIAKAANVATSPAAAARKAPQTGAAAKGGTSFPSAPPPPASAPQVAKKVVPSPAAPLSTTTTTTTTTELNPNAAPFRPSNSNPKQFAAAPAVLTRRPKSTAQAPTSEGILSPPPGANTNSAPPVVQTSSSPLLSQPGGGAPTTTAPPQQQRKSLLPAPPKSLLPAPPIMATATPPVAGNTNTKSKEQPGASSGQKVAPAKNPTPSGKKSAPAPKAGGKKGKAGRKKG